jgi:hypothetical protein
MMLTRLLIAGVTAVLTPSLLVAQAVMFRGGPEHHGVYRSAAPTLQDVAWKFQTAGRVISSPVVSGGAVFVGHGRLPVRDRPAHLVLVARDRG